MSSDFFDNYDFFSGIPNVEPVKEEPVVVNLPFDDDKRETETAEDVPVENISNVEEEKTEENVENLQPTEENIVEEVVVEQEPEKPKRRKRRTKEEIEADKLKVAEEKAVESEEAEEEDVSENISEIKTENAKFNPSKLNFVNVMERISSIAVDDKWDEFQKRINEKFDKIQLDTDINLGSLKFTLSMVASLYPELRMARAEVNSDWDTLTNKLTGLIPRQQIMNLNGSSADMRKKKSYEACESYKIDGIRGTINLYDLEATLRKRKEWIQAKEDSLNKIHSCAIGYLTIFKLMENDKQ